MTTTRAMTSEKTPAKRPSSPLCEKSHEAVKKGRDKKPLAELDYQEQIALQFQSRFEPATERSSEEALRAYDSMVEPKRRRLTREDLLRQAVDGKDFGEHTTRTRHLWHPAKDMCKRFNQPDPFPDSLLQGTVGLSDRREAAIKKPGSRSADLMTFF